jgi:hypothetical protein
VGSVSTANGQARARYCTLSKKKFHRRFSKLTIGLQANAKQASKMFLTAAANNKKRALTDPRAPTPFAEKHATGCLWSGKTWTTLFVDEGHYARTPSRLFHGLNALGKVSAAKVFATATPLVNEPKVNLFDQLQYLKGEALTLKCLRMSLILDVY